MVRCIMVFLYFSFICSITFFFSPSSIGISEDRNIRRFYSIETWIPASTKYQITTPVIRLHVIIRGETDTITVLFALSLNGGSQRSSAVQIDPSSLFAFEIVIISIIGSGIRKLNLHRVNSSFTFRTACRKNSQRSLRQGFIPSSLLALVISPFRGTDIHRIDNVFVIGLTFR